MSTPRQAQRNAEHCRGRRRNDEHADGAHPIHGSTVPPAVGPIQSASVSANPSVVSTNTTASNNQTQIRALFVGLNNAPIQNVRVLFDLNGDANSVGGTFATGTNVVYSDANGAATTSYIPGSRSSPTNGLTIRACYSTTDFPAEPARFPRTTTVTVVSNPLSVSIGSNAEIAGRSRRISPTYANSSCLSSMRQGTQRAMSTLSPSLDLDYFYKGQYVNPGAWFPGTVDSTVVPPQYSAVPPIPLSQRRPEPKRRAGDRRRHQPQRQLSSRGNRMRRSRSSAADRPTTMGPPWCRSSTRRTWAAGCMSISSCPRPGSAERKGVPFGRRFYRYRHQFCR